MDKKRISELKKFIRRARREVDRQYARADRLENRDTRWLYNERADRLISQIEEARRELSTLEPAEGRSTLRPRKETDYTTAPVKAVKCADGGPPMYAEIWQTSLHCHPRSTAARFIVTVAIDEKTVSLPRHSEEHREAEAAGRLRVATNVRAGQATRTIAEMQKEIRDAQNSQLS